MVLEAEGQRGTVAGENLDSGPEIEREIEAPCRRNGNVVVEIKHSRMNIGEGLHFVMTPRVQLKPQRRDSVRIVRSRLLRKHGVDLAVEVLLRRLMQHSDRNDFAHPSQRGVFAVQNYYR